MALGADPPLGSGPSAAGANYGASTVLSESSPDDSFAIRCFETVRRRQ